MTIKINEKILANEGKIVISIMMGVASWVMAIIVVIFLLILSGEFWLPVAFVGIIINIFIAYNYKKADFLREYIIDDIPSPLLSIPIGVVIVIGLTLYIPLIFILSLFTVYLYNIKRK